jgi:ferritin-like metal-binding protein YciE
MDNDLHELFLNEIGDIYDAEQQLLKALPKFAKAADSGELGELIESHLEETEEHISRLEKAAEALDESIRNKKCKAMKGLIEEAEDTIKEQKGSKALDAGIIAEIQKIEHYEVSTYGSICAWAEQMGHDEVYRILRQTEEEECATDERLTHVAESIANHKALTE